MTPLLFLLLACGDTTGTDSATDSATTETTETTETTDTGPAEVHQLSVQDLKAWLDGGEDFLLINVHVPYAGEIPGTDTHIAYTKTSDLAAEIGDLDRTTVVYCLSGPMSAKAAADLVDLGYRQIYDLPEAMMGWEDAGYELTE